jgi:hypothetical protein
MKTLSTAALLTITITITLALGAGSAEARLGRVGAKVNRARSANVERSRQPYVVLRGKPVGATPRLNLSRGRTRAIRAGIAESLGINPRRVRFRSQRRPIPGLSTSVDHRAVRWWVKGQQLRGTASTYTPITTTRRGGAATAVGQVKVNSSR